MYFIPDEKTGEVIEQEQRKEKAASICIGVFSFEDAEKKLEPFALEKGLLQECITSPYSKYESMDCFDLISLNIVDFQNFQSGRRRVVIFLNRELALFFSDEPLRVCEYIKNCMAKREEGVSADRIVHDFLQKLSVGDMAFFDAMEREILELEKALITTKKSDCVQEIISLRKRLMLLKRYYEQLNLVLDGVLENENQLYQERTIQCFERMEKRNERLFQNVLNLRDYVTQVRESYQAEVDINLNVTMKVYTVITTIFFPLTVIVGWYGMNFDMPEYDWKYGYWIVTGISLALVIGTIYYFKRKKWF